MSFDCCNSNAFDYLSCESSIAGTIANFKNTACCDCSAFDVTTDPNTDNYTFADCCPNALPQSFCLSLFSNPFAGSPYIQAGATEVTMTFDSSYQGWISDTATLTATTLGTTDTGCSSWDGVVRMKCNAAGTWDITLELTHAGNSFVGGGTATFVSQCQPWIISNELLIVDSYPGCGMSDVTGRQDVFRLDTCNAIVTIATACGCLPMPVYLCVEVISSSESCMPVGTSWIAEYDPTNDATVPGSVYYWYADLTSLGCTFIGGIAMNCFTLTFSSCNFQACTIGDHSYGASCYPWIGGYPSSSTWGQQFCPGSVYNPIGSFDFIMEFSTINITLRVSECPL